MINYVHGYSLERLEREWILQALRFHGNNKTQTAASLGVALRTLRYKLQKYKEEGHLPSNVKLEDDTSQAD